MVQQSADLHGQSGGKPVRVFGSLQGEVNIAGCAATQAYAKVNLIAMADQGHVLDK